MSTKQQILTAIDRIEEVEYPYLLHILIKFMPNSEILPDEIMAFERAENSYKNGDVVNHSDINWDE